MRSSDSYSSGVTGQHDFMVAPLGLDIRSKTELFDYFSQKQWGHAAQVFFESYVVNGSRLINHDITFLGISGAVLG